MRKSSCAPAFAQRGALKPMKAVAPSAPDVLYYSITPWDGHGQTGCRHLPMWTRENHQRGAALYLRAPESWGGWITRTPSGHRPYGARARALLSSPSRRCLVDGRSRSCWTNAGSRGLLQRDGAHLQVLDCAILVISGTDGVQGHTHTLWRLLERYGGPPSCLSTRWIWRGGQGRPAGGPKAGRTRVDFTAPAAERDEAPSAARTRWSAIRGRGAGRRYLTALSPGGSSSAGSAPPS